MTPTGDTAADRESLSFEQAVNRLDETVRALESGGIPLDEAMKLFESGMQLARLCSEMLASAELRITRIQTAYGEQMSMLEEAPGQGDEPC